MQCRDGVQLAEEERHSTEETAAKRGVRESQTEAVERHEEIVRKGLEAMKKERK